MAQLIGRRYSIGDKLGQGGMGVVYRGVDTQTEMPVAIKQLHTDITNEEQIARFQREGSALRDLNHPNIVKMLDTAEEDGQYYLIIEYVSGGDLNQLLSDGALPVATVVKMAIDISDALTRSHKLGIIHRDLKPANVLIAKDDTLRLTDFGIARVIHQDTVGDTDKLVGTIDYIAPELFNGEIATAQADIWAFGVMLFQMLTGVCPFHRDTLSQTLMAISHDPIPDIRELREDIPTALEDLLYRMLERDPHERISSIRYVGAILEDIQEGRTTQDIVMPSSDVPQTDTVLKHNLPADMTEFVGREAEIKELQKLLAGNSRLITILAPGGMGKTRLSLAVARSVLSDYADGVYFIELAELTDASAIIPTIASAMGAQLPAGTPPQQALTDFISSKSMLLVMDNYEHLLDGADIVGDLLQATPNLTVIATSRQRLNQAGETLFHLSGMDFPEWETPADAENFAAVKLFMGSALRARPDFELTVDNLPFVARICRLVQGMPLGIVLSAAWLSMLSPEEIAQEITEGIDFLEADEGDIPARQKSIRVVFDYAWQMMDDSERQIMTALSIFQGGFTREAAQAVTGASIRQLLKLKNLSLLNRDSDSGRYSIHELLRQYAYEQLQHADYYAEVQEEFARYYQQLAQTIYPDLINYYRQAIDTFTLETENFKIAWDWGVIHQDSEVLNALMDVLNQWLGVNATRTPEWLKKLRAIYDFINNEAFTEVLRTKWIVTGGIGSGLAEYDFDTADKRLQRGLQRLREIGTNLDIATYMQQATMVYLRYNKTATAKTLAEEVFERSKDIEQYSLMARTATNLGYLYSATDDFDISMTWYQTAHQFAKQANNMMTLSLATYNLGNLYLHKHDFDKVREHMEEIFNLTYITYPVLYIHSHHMIAQLHIRDGEHELAEAHLQKGVDYATRSRNIDALDLAHGVYAAYMLRRGRFDEAIAKIDYLLDEVIPAGDQMARSFTAVMKALALWGQGQEDEATQIILAMIPIHHTYTHLEQLFHSLLGLAFIWERRNQPEKALQILGLLRSRTTWLTIGDDHVIVQALDTKLISHFSPADYERIHQEGAELNYQDYALSLPDRITELSS